MTYKITMIDYRKILYRDNDDGTWSEIPFDEGSQDYAEYLRLVAEGMEVVDETPKEVYIQAEIARLQALLEEQEG